MKVMIAQHLKFHSRARLTAWLGVVAVCMQLLAGGVSNWHLMQRLVDAPPGSFVHCLSINDIRSDGRDPSPAKSGATSQHCPYCLAAIGTLMPPTVRLAVLLPPAHRLMRQAIPVGMVPRPLDLRHARSRAPPLFA